MIYKVLPNKIPEVWELIKFSVQKANSIEGDYAKNYMNNLLHALLSGKAQAFIRVNDTKDSVKTIVVTRIHEDEISNEKHLIIQSYYAFEESDLTVWKNNMDFSIEFAKKNGCTKISVDTNNKKIIDLAKHFGYIERHVVLDYSLGGV